MKKIVAIIQARTNSNRFPGKVLKEICGVPMILFQINRLKKSEKTCKNCLKACKYMDKIIEGDKLRKDKDIFQARYPRICRKEKPNGSRKAY